MWKTAFKNLKGFGLLKRIISLHIFKGCLPQILFGPLLNTLSHMMWRYNYHVYVLGEPNEKILLKYTVSYQNKLSKGVDFKLFLFNHLIFGIWIQHIVLQTALLFFVRLAEISIFKWKNNLPVMLSQKFQKVGD